MSRRVQLALKIICAFAALTFLRFYVSTTYMWLNLPGYLSGHERLPFQLRVLPIPFLLAFNKLPTLFPILGHGEAVLTPERFGFFLLSLIAFTAATYFLVQLYRAVSPTRLFQPVIVPLFIILCLWTYCIHVGQVLSYPYDLPAVAFFTAGLLFLYQRRFLPLAIVLLLGTLNRETTLFLIPLYLIDAASNPEPIPPTTALRNRLSLRNLTATNYLRAALLTLLWLAIQLTLRHHFALNDHSEDFLRVRENIRNLSPRFWPAILNIGGYSLPALILLRRHLQPARFANYLLIIPPWVAVMFCKGVLTETRIYGELTAFFAVAIVLLLEDHASAVADPRATDRNN